MNPSTALATVLLDELVRGGVRDLVLSPGSRSAPLAYAALAAERARRLRLHVRVDERSAGFLALGLAKGSRRPVPVVMTSGTAVANLHPAVLEAHHGGVPLIVLSADRPGELRHTGANQTTRQPGMFGSAVRLAVDLPAAEIVPDQNDWWRSTICRALAAARGSRGLAGGRGGPVHVNCGFRQPLVPGHPGDRDFVANWPESLSGRPRDAAWVRVEPSAVTAAPLADVPRTLVVIGSLDDPEDAATAVAWARRRGYPVIAEPFGRLTGGTLPGGPLVLTATDWLKEHLPDRVVVVGRVTLARAVGSLLRRSGVEVELVGSDGPWADPSRVARIVHPFAALTGELAAGDLASRELATGGAVPDTAARVADPITTVPSDTAAADATPETLAADATPDSSATGDAATSASRTRTAAPRTDAGWAASWQAAGRRLAPLRAELPWDTGLAAAAAFSDAVPTGSVIVVGSSNPVRDLDLALDRDNPKQLLVLANRGLAGIDGIVSTALGVALTCGRPTYALLGDLTFLHDTNGLLIGPDEPSADATLVVVNDDGGGIFTTLEHGAPERAGDFERIFGTPTRTDLAALCGVHGIRYERARTRAELAAAVAREPDGIRVIEVAISRGSHRRAHADLRAAAAAALSG